ncbi:MAG: S-layer homology domain-containing protein [Synergistaceae bacterium]|nr:S-layer homology domain-containing protein [Synergistaceae bacterium]
MSVFADEAGVADYAREAVQALAAAGVLNGRPGNIFDPQGRATRDEVAAVLHRFLEAAE